MEKSVFSACQAWTRVREMLDEKRCVPGPDRDPIASDQGVVMRASLLPARTRSDEGFTLIELVAALAILLIVAMGVIGAMTFTAQAAQSTGMRNGALAVGQEQLEKARNIPYDSVGVRYATGGYGDPPGTILSPAYVSSGDTTYTVYTNVTWVRDTDPPYRAKYKKVTVMVEWSDPTTGSISLETGIFGKSYLLDNGDLEITVKDRNSPFPPIPGAQVIIDPTASGALPRTGWTDTTGKLFYGFIEPGTVTMTVDAPGYIVDPSQYATYTIVGQTLNTMVLYVQRPSTIRTYVIDSGGSALASAAVTASSPRFGTRTFYTDAQGYALFPDSFVGTYTVSVVKDGYASPPAQEATITAGDQEVQVNFTANMTASCHVTVIDSVTGLPVSGATVTVRDAGGTNAPNSPGTTPSTGDLLFPNMIAGLYDINVTRTGVAGTGPAYTATATADVNVTYGAATDVNIRIVPWGTLWIRAQKADNSYLTGTTIVGTLGGTQIFSKKTDSNGYLKVPYLQQGTYVLKRSGGTTTFNYVVTDGVIPTAATVIKGSW